MPHNTPTLLPVYMLYFTTKTSIRDVEVVEGAILNSTIDVFPHF